jgi:hypothetical protein
VIVSLKDLRLNATQLVDTFSHLYNFSADITDKLLASQLNLSAVSLANMQLVKR